MTHSNPNSREPTLEALDWTSHGLQRSPLLVWLTAVLAGCSSGMMERAARRSGCIG